MPYVPPETQLAQALAGDPAISARVAAANIRGGLLQRNGPMPAILFTRVSTVRDVGSGSMTLDRGYTGFCWGRFQIDHFSNDYNEAVLLAIASKLVVARLDLTSGNGYAKANAILNERDLGDNPNQAGSFCRSVDVKIWFIEEGRDG